MWRDSEGERTRKEKNPPRVFPGRCNKGLCYEKTGGCLLKFLERGLIAVNAYQDRAAVIQSQHTHQALSADVLVAVANKHIKRLLCRQSNKGLYIRERSHSDAELSHKIPLRLYKCASFVYNGGVH